MVTRISNSKYLTVEPLLPAENLGWEVLVISPEDWTTVLARSARFIGLEGSQVRNDFGSGSLTLDASDSALTAPLPLEIEGTILDRECLFQMWEDGLLRHEFLGEDAVEDIVVDGEDPVTKISGRTTEKVLEWAVHVPLWGETQDYTVSDDATGGTYRLSVGFRQSNGKITWQKTGPIAWNASAAHGARDAAKRGRAAARAGARRFLARVGNEPTGLQPEAREPGKLLQVIVEKALVQFRSARL